MSDETIALSLSERTGGKDTPPYQPHSHEAEQALLSILLHTNQALESLPDSLQAEHFHHPLHQRLYKTITLLIQRGQLANPITLANYFQKEIGEKGGEEGEWTESSYLTEISGLFLPARNAKDYAQQIYELYLRRRLIALGQDIIEEAKVQDVQGMSPLQHVEAIEHQLFSLVTWGQDRGTVQFSLALQEAILSAELAYKRDSHVVGVTTGLTDLDKLLGGLHPSDLLILAGRPGMGKTMLATNIAFNAAKARVQKNSSEGAAVAFFSLEMSANQLAMRILGQESGVPSDRIRRGAIDQDSFPKFIEVAKDLAELPLFIDDTPGLSIASLLTRARRLKRKEDIGLIVVDYLQLLTLGHQKWENRVQELSEITRGLKNLAKELNVPVLALSQLSRAVEQREDKRPQLADLRESGSIEQDADVVMFVYREEYYEARKKPTAGSEKMTSWQQTMSNVHNVAEVIIAKQRHGPTASIALHFDGPKTKFSNLSEEEGLRHAF